MLSHHKISRSQKIPQKTKSRRLHRHQPSITKFQRKIHNSPIRCNDELIINSVLKDVNRPANPLTRKIVIHKPFPLSLGGVLPHLELEFLDISHHPSSQKHFDHLVKYTTDVRNSYINSIEEIKKDDLWDKLHNNLSVDNSVKYTQNSYISLPSTNLPSFTSYCTNTDTNDIIHQHNTVPITFVYPSMSHSSNVTNPIHYAALNNKLATIRQKHHTSKKDENNVDKYHSKSADIVSKLDELNNNIPEQFHGDKGWWQTFVRPSLPPRPSVISPQNFNVENSDEITHLQYNDKNINKFGPIDMNISIDLNYSRLISLSPIGSAYGSSSPLTPDPLKLLNSHKFFKNNNNNNNNNTANPTNDEMNAYSQVCFRGDFPIITPFDQAVASIWLLDALGIVDVHSRDKLFPKPQITEVLSGVATILPQHLLEHTLDNLQIWYNDKNSQINKNNNNNDDSSKNNDNDDNNNNNNTDLNGSSITSQYTISHLEETPKAPYVPCPIKPIGLQYPQPYILHGTTQRSSITFHNNTSHHDKQHDNSTFLSKIDSQLVLHAAIGSSMGGQSALAMGSLYPGLFSRIVAMATTSKTSPHTQAIRSIQRRAVMNDPQWSHGLFNTKNMPLSGLYLSRMIGMLNYRSTQEFDTRFETIPAKSLHNQVEYYLQHNGEKFSSFNPLCYVVLSKSMDLMDLSIAHTTWKHGIKAIGGIPWEHIDEKQQLSQPLHLFSSTNNTSPTELLLCGIKQDELIPYTELQELSRIIGRVIPTHYETISSLYGHDAFLIDIKQFGPRLSHFLFPNQQTGITNLQHYFKTLE